MDEKRDEQIMNTQDPAVQQAGGGPPRKGKGKALTGILVGVIALLALALVFFATPLRDLFVARNTVPEITLELVGGSAVREADGKYSFEVEAKVKGKPMPVVSFNRNDRLGETVENRTCIILEPEETFTLVATAVNSLGQASDTLELRGSDEHSVGEAKKETADETDKGKTAEETGTKKDTGSTTPAANRPPVITAINLPAGPFYFGDQYTVTVQATDPDGDPLSYHWEVSGVGSTANPAANPVALAMPAIPGGTTSLALIPGETGYVMKNDQAFNFLNVFIGDWANNMMCRGFISFDISNLVKTCTVKVTVRDNRGGEAVQSKTVDVVPRVHKAVLRLPNPNINGNQFFIVPFTLNIQDGTSKTYPIQVLAVHWGPRGFQLSDYNISGSLVAEIVNLDCTWNSVIGGENDALAKALQKSINERKERFQLLLHLYYDESNNDGKIDGVFYQRDEIKLWINH